MWNKIKKFFKRWPKLIRIEVRDGNCKLIDTGYCYINSWKDLIPAGERFALKTKINWNCDATDEVYWNYTEIKR